MNWSHLARQTATAIGALFVIAAVLYFAARLLVFEM